MVLVRDGRAEEGHEAVAQELVHGPLVAVDLGEHQLEGAIHELVDVLRVETLGQCGEARDVHEEDGDELALALQRALRDEDLLGQVLGGVALRFRESRRERGRRGVAELFTAAVAEAAGGWIDLVAGGTRQHQPGSAAVAEPRVRRVVLLALGTLHWQPSRAGRSWRSEG